MRRLLLIITISILFFFLSCASTPPPQLNQDELQMLAEIRSERGEKNAHKALKLLQEAKVIRQEDGDEKALEYLMRVGTRFPYEAMKIHETLFPEKAVAYPESRAEEPRVSSKEEEATTKMRVSPSAPEHREPTRVTRKKDLRGADYFLQGRKAYENGEYQLCIDKLSKAIPLLKGNEERIDALRTMAFAYMAFPKQEEARQQFCNILRLDPAFELDPIMTPPKVLAVF